MLVRVGSLLASNPVGGLVSAAALLAAGEDEALAIDFTDYFYESSTSLYGSAYVRDTATPANNVSAAPDAMRVTSTAIAFDTLPPTHGASISAATRLSTAAFGADTADALTVIVTLHDGGADFKAGVSIGGVGSALTAWDGVSGAPTPGGLSGACIIKNCLIVPRAMTEAQLEAATA